jgi:NhaP-type Na+/H+ or K+/H+ antiporter
VIRFLLTGRLGSARRGVMDLLLSAVFGVAVGSVFGYALASVVSWFFS